MKWDQRKRGLYVLGQRATGCKRLAGYLFTLQDNRTDIPLLFRDPRGQPNAIDVAKEDADDATTMDTDSIQPEA
jgi:hypothetical protein